MPSDRDSRSIRNLLLVIVFQLGLCVIVLAEVANAAREYSTLLPTVAQLVGSVTAVGALLAFLVKSSPGRNVDDSPE